MRLRDRLGLWHYRLADDWPWRALARSAQRRRRALGPLIERLPPVAVSDDARVEVHVLSGDAQADLGVVSSWSLLRFLSGASLVVHSDGTLSGASQARWRARVPGVRFVSEDEARAASQRLLEGLPEVARWHARNWAAQQTVDFSACARAPRLLSLDTDVLCFQPPRAVLDWLDAGAAPARWNRDLGTRYSAPLDVLKAATGLELPERLNCGFMLTPRFGRDDFERLERALRGMSRAGLDMNQLWSSQTYLAVMAAHHPGAAALPAAYDVRRGPTRPDEVVRHYVGMPSVRFRLFTEGWPRVFAQAGLGDAAR
ncbi:MAG: hypothetical protein INH41_22655 [Myxococcaceae bacterium]|jgi:hypothetical protein|nr:hypothetical protein [Myxococcaceae bacterium]MCA3015199.1 hypothetical protein [Myxococcaceae bacterium]